MTAPSCCLASSIQGDDALSTIKALRSKKLSEEISGTLLARKAGIDRSRVSFMECGHLQPTAEELQRLSVALEQLIAAKHKVNQVAVEVGWPVGA